MIVEGFEMKGSASTWANRYYRQMAFGEITSRTVELWLIDQNVPRGAAYRMSGRILQKGKQLGLWVHKGNGLWKIQVGHQPLTTTPPHGTDTLMSGPTPPQRLNHTPPTATDSSKEQSFGTFYNPTDHKGRSVRITHISAYVSGEYNPVWEGCVVVVGEGPTDGIRKMDARQKRLEIEIAKSSADVCPMSEPTP